MPSLAARCMVLLIAVTAVSAVAVSRPAAVAQDSPVQVYLDTRPEEVGIQQCVSTTSGETLAVDIVATGLPASTFGLEMALYVAGGAARFLPPALTDVDPALAGWVNRSYGAGGPEPTSGGGYPVAAADPTGGENAVGGDHIVARLVLNAVAPGTTRLFFAGIFFVVVSGEPVSVPSGPDYNPAIVVVDGDCPPLAATATPCPPVGCPTPAPPVAATVPPFVPPPATPAPPPEGAPPARFSVDADPSLPGIQTSVTVPVGQPFSVHWHIDPGGTGTYRGYQGKMAFDGSILRLVSAGPLGTLCSVGQTCVEAGPVIIQPPESYDTAGLGQATIFAGEGVLFPTRSAATFAGEVYRITLECVSEGVSPLDLRPPPDDPLEQESNLSPSRGRPVSTFDAEVRCGRGAPVALPSTGSGGTLNGAGAGRWAVVALAGAGLFLLAAFGVTALKSLRH